jgi:hypothetical protein
MIPWSFRSSETAQWTKLKQFWRNVGERMQELWSDRAKRSWDTIQLKCARAPRRSTFVRLGVSRSHFSRVRYRDLTLGGCIKDYYKSFTRNSPQTMPGVFSAANLRPSFCRVHLSTTRVFGRVLLFVPGVR